MIAILPYFSLVLGFVLLVKGADLLVDGASSIARRFNVSDLVIGLTVVAFGTSLPEFVTCLTATVKRHGEICNALPELRSIPLSFEPQGSKVIYIEETGYAPE